jgi:hypothetical protein
VHDRPWLHSRVVTGAGDPVHRALAR